jgi:hypothetical protein
MNLDSEFIKLIALSDSIGELIKDKGEPFAIVWKKEQTKERATIHGNNNYHTKI